MRQKILELFLVTALFFPLPLFFLQESSGTPPAASVQMIAYVAVAVPQILIVVYILVLQKAPLAVFGWKRPDRSTWGWLVLGWSTGFLLVLSLVYLLRLFPGVDWQSQKPPLRITSAAEIPLVVLFCAAVGYKEELFFRSYLLTRLGELGVKPLWSVIATSLIFGLAHLNQGIIGAAGISLIGALFGAIFIKRRDLHAVAGAHALYDLTLLILNLVNNPPGAA